MSEEILYQGTATDSVGAARFGPRSALPAAALSPRTGSDLIGRSCWVGACREEGRRERLRAQATKNKGKANLDSVVEPARVQTSHRGNLRQPIRQGIPMNSEPF